MVFKHSEIDQMINQASSRVGVQFAFLYELPRRKQRGILMDQHHSLIRRKRRGI